MLWILSAVLVLVGVIACVTIILLPVGIPLLGYARRLFFFSLKLMLPRAVSHPVATAEKSAHERGRRMRKTVAVNKPDTKTMRKWSSKKTKDVRKKLPVGS